MASACLQDQANGSRISRLLVDKGTEAMRKTFDNIHPPATLAAVLATNKTLLLRLKPRIINNLQWDLLYPPSGNPADSKTFDVTLLTVLLRNICKLPAPITGWNTMPPDTDRSTEANIARIKFFRNEIYAHVTTTLVDNVKFENLWQKISKALVDLNIPQSEIDVLKHSPLSPEEEMYVQQLKDWKLREDECKDILDKTGSNVQELKQVAEETHQNVNETQRDVKEIQRVVKETQDSGVEVRRKLEEFIANYSKESSRKDQKDQENLQQLAKHNFKGRITSAVKSFHEGTRDWLLKRLDEWFTDQESRVLILTAGPGVGKSVFAGKVCQIYGEMGKLAACHFCKFNDSNLRNPLSMLQSLASQMCDNVKGFKEKLLEQLKRPHVVNTLTDAFRVYLHDPLQDLESKEPMLIVIDGLDESESNGKSELLDLISDEFSELQEWIKILVTSRPEIPVKEKLKNLNPVEILPEDEDNESDLRQYLKFCLSSLLDKFETKIRFGVWHDIWRGLEDEDRDEEDEDDDDDDDDADHDHDGDYDDYEYPFQRCFKKQPPNKNTVISLLVEKCEGSFLFAFHVQSELLKRGILADLTIDEIENFLPEGIGSVYERYFSRLQNALKCVNKDVDVFKLLEILAVARGPLPLKFITHALGMSPDTRAMKKIINEVNEKISALLFVSDDLVTVFHKSVVDWLTSNGYEEHQYTVDEENGNELLWRCCEKEFKEIKRNIFNLKLSNEMKYSLEHGYSHLVACKTKYCQESCAWLQDVSIIHVISAVYPKDATSLKASWKEILRQKHGLNRQLRIKISWNLYESEDVSMYLESGRHVNRSPEYRFLSDEDEGIGKYSEHVPSYLQSLINRSPENCFSDEDKRIAKYILKKFGWCEKLDASRKEKKNTFLVKLFSCRITSFDVSSDKKLVAVGHKDGTISFLELPELKELWRYSSTSSVRCCNFLPQASLLLYGRMDTAIDVRAGKEVSFFCENDEIFSSCAFSPSGQRMVTSNGSEIIKLWDIAEKRLLALLRGGGSMDCCSFSQNGSFIIGEELKSTYLNSLSIWNAITLQRVDGRNMFANSRKGTLFSTDYTGNAVSVKCDNVSICKGCLQQSTEDIIFLRDDRDVMVYGLPHPSPFARISFLLGDISVTSYQRSNCIFVFAWHSLLIIEPFHFSKVAVSGRFVLYTSRRGEEKILQRYVKSLDQDSWLYIDHDKLLGFSIPPHEEKAVSYSSSDVDHVVGCSYSPDGSRLASCTTDGFINIWSVHECQIVQSFRGCGTLPAACWWSEGFLMVFCLIEDKAMLSKYPVDEELTIRVAQRKDHALDCTVDETLKILAFSDGVLIFKLRSNRKIKILDVHEIEDQRWIKLPEIENMECFAVSPGGDSILGVGCEKFRIWKKNDQSPTDYEMWREDDFKAYLGSQNVDFYYSNLNNPRCNVNTDGMFGVISLATTLKYEFLYYDLEDVPYDELGVLFIVVNMDSGDITNYYFDESLGEEDYDEDLGLRTEVFGHFNLFASRTFFAVMGPVSLAVFDIKTCEQTASLSAKLLSRSATIFPLSAISPQGLYRDTYEGTESALSPDGNILAISRGKGHMDFVRIHVPE